MKKLSLSELYAEAAAICLLLLALVNKAWLMLGVSIVGLVTGMILARRPSAEGEEGVVLGSLRRAGVFGLVGFAAALAFAIIIIIRG